MPKFRMYGLVGATKVLGVIEAATEEEAIQKSWHNFDCSVSLCHQCANELDAEEVYKIDAELIE